MGSTTSCNGPCCQWAIAPLDGSEAMRTGAVLSTRAISTSAGRRSPVRRVSWRASDSDGAFSCERSRKMGLLMDVCSHQRAINAVIGVALLAEPFQPVLETHRAEPGVIARDKRLIV